MPALLIFAYFRYAQTAKIIARISSPYVRKCWRSAVREGRDRQGSGTRPRGSPGLQTRALRRRRLWLWQVRALVRNARTAAARRGAACGRYRGNPMRNAGWLIAGFFAGSEPRFFSEPGFWSRSDALRRPERGAGLAVCACSAGLAGLWVFGGLCGFAGLAGSAGCGTSRGHSRNRRPPMPKPHARATRAISPGHLPMMVRLLARISRNDLHWLNTLDAQELRALLQLIATAKTRRLNIATLLEEHNRHCTG